MELVNDYIDAISGYIDTKGVVDRRRFWRFIIAVLIVDSIFATIVFLLSSRYPEYRATYSQLLLALFHATPVTTISLMRLRDAGKQWQWFCAPFLPLLLIPFVYTLMYPFVTDVTPYTTKLQDLIINTRTILILLCILASLVCSAILIHFLSLPTGGRARKQTLVERVR